MEDVFNQLPEHIQGHLRKITETSGLPVTEESYQLIAQNWLEKMNSKVKEYADKASNPVISTKTWLSYLTILRKPTKKE